MSEKRAGGGLGEQITTHSLKPHSILEPLNSGIMYWWRPHISKYIRTPDAKIVFLGFQRGGIRLHWTQKSYFWSSKVAYVWF